MFKQKNVISSQSAFCFILQTLRQNSENTFPNITNRLMQSLGRQMISRKV